MKHRMLRVNELLKRELSGIIAREMSFEGALVTINHVDVSADLKNAHVYVSVLGSDLGKKVRVWNEDGMLEKYSFLSRADLLTKPPHTGEDVDVAIALDTAIQNRLGTAFAAVRSTRIWINIDHHLSNPGYGDLVYVDPAAPATGQIIFDLIKSQGFPFSREIAENLYAAISTDTGSFQYPKTSARTFEIAAELVCTGIDVGRLSQQLYENYPRRRVELLRELLRTMRFERSGRVASFSLTLKTTAELQVLPEDNEGLIDHLRAIRGVIVAVFFEELADGKVRVSMRSKTDTIDVCVICQTFGGGGHTLAAGARVRGTLAEVEQRVLEEICDVVKSHS